MVAALSRRHTPALSGGSARVARTKKNRLARETVQSLSGRLAGFGIGAAGFEPTTPTTPKWCATKLRYAPVEAGKSKLSQRLGGVAVTA